MNNRVPKILTIRSEVSELKHVESFLNEVFTEFNLSKKCFNKTLLCVSEAVVNSIYHGNKKSIDKKVIISASCVSKNLKLKIKDEGKGFDLSCVEDPTLKTNLKKESGRGIHIIKSLTDNLEYIKSENSLELKISCGE